MFFLSSPVFAKDIVVDQSGPVRTITQALKMAHAGDRIIITAGTYREKQITVNQSVTLIGRNHPVIDGEGKYQILYVTADSVTIEGITFENAGISYVHDNAAIKMNRVTGGVIRHNRLINNFFGIYLAKSHDCLIDSNTVINHAISETASGGGVHLWNCDHITVSNNYLRGNRDGIYFEFVNHSRVEHNLSEKNIRYGLHLMYSNYDTYRYNDFKDNRAGGVVMYSNYITVLHNTFEHNWGPSKDGVLLKELNHGTIRHNKFYQNTTAIYSEGSNYVRIEDNDLIENGWGVNIMSNSMHDVFTRNNFMNNTFDVATSGQRNYNTFTQNYWSAYQGYDINRDGLGDVPYHPVRLYAVVVSQQPTSLILLHSLFVQVLDIAEKVFPVLTPETLIDSKPLMKPYHDTTGKAGQIVQYTASAQGY